MKNVIGVAAAGALLPVALRAAAVAGLAKERARGRGIVARERRAGADRSAGSAGSAELIGLIGLIGSVALAALRIASRTLALVEPRMDAQSRWSRSRPR